MNTDLSLAQNHAFQLSRTLMVPVTLFRSGDELRRYPDSVFGLTAVMLAA
ncbi:hypothetical protein [Rhizobium rhizogenes]|nr:hypothetical protein [Rhizobium rhizogenes]MDJ1637437.1 hypothetical protein [Rhizobium rhizogenes]